MKKFNILYLICFIFILNRSGLPAGNKINDPISNSYILNNLKMDSDKVYFISEKNIADGEIIFDNSFDDNLNLNTEPKPIKKYKHKSSDKRYHLKEYLIKQNENLGIIAKKNGTTINILKEINNIKDEDHILVNTTIMIPSFDGIFYKIKKGDTLTKISKNYNIEIDVIAEHNNIDSNNLIAGKKIFLPEATERRINETSSEKTLIAGYKELKIKKNITIKKQKSKLNSKKSLLLAWPLRGPITSGFGIRTHPFSGDKKFHCGLDIGANVGTVVRASSEGRVIFSGWKDLYGNMIVIAHKNNYITVYAHNSKNLVSVNEKVKQGQKIALSGKTGAVTGAHLHFEIRKGIVPLNPSRILK